MFIVMMVSILFFAIFFSLIEALTGWKPSKQIFEILIRIGSVPLIAGLSYEVLKLLAKFDNPIVNLLKAPGRGMQLITTKEPDDSMIEVAITAFNTVLKLEEDESLATTKFRVSVTLKKVLEDMKAINPEKTYENEEIVMSTLGYNNRTMIKGERAIYKDIADQMLEICRKRVETGTPLQYLLGKAPFYGYEFKVNENVLIPRFDTEILVENAIKEIGDREVEVLDMCTGSGAIAITVQKNTKAIVSASDISSNALNVARENALNLGASVRFIESDLFENIEGTYDLILINPPYIPTSDIETLDSEVKNYEPKLALDGGVDGLDIYRRISESYLNYLNDNGVLMLEIGIGQSEQIKELFGDKVTFISDYNNPPIERVAIIRKGE
jgi:release factor-specific protein-(glutamine-N5) methyltransferase